MSSRRKPEPHRIPKTCLGCHRPFLAQRMRNNFCSRSCAIRQTSTRHGYTTHTKAAPTYKSWDSMKARCLYPSSPKFATYGAIGISFVESWQKFENFLADMGERPDGTTLDRIDNTKGYCKENCRWATRVEQQRNLRSNRLLTHNGITQCLTAWAECTEIKAACITSRLRRGWPIDKALTVPTSRRHVA
jgi:hypothetical protein